jgi:hypothetical protein
MRSGPDGCSEQILLPSDNGVQVVSLWIILYSIESGFMQKIVGFSTVIS